MPKDIFLSHAWANDNFNRNNHKRCKVLCDKLLEKGYSVWFDEYDMVGNIDNCIIKNINNCNIVLICLTEEYNKKLNNGINGTKINDNCFKEWNYILFKNKPIIPIFMEEKMFELFNSNEGGLLNMYLNSLVYMNITDDDYVNNDFDLLCKTLQKNKIYTKNQKKILKIKTDSSYDNLIKYFSNVLKPSSPRKKIMHNDKKILNIFTAVDNFKMLTKNKNKNKNKIKNGVFIKI